MFLVALALAETPADPCRPQILEYRHLVELTNPGSGTRTERYRFSAPPGSCTSIELPRQLEGMKLENGDLVVKDRKMTRLSSFSEGEMLILSRTEALSGVRLAGAVTQPAFPVEFMVVELAVGAKARVSIWTPQDAKVEVRKRDTGRLFRASFGSEGRVVWSTETSWWDVSASLGAMVDKQVPVGRNLTRMGDFATDASTLTLEAAQKRVWERIALDPTGADWSSLRPLSEVLEAGKGGAAERAVALITLLRAAGYDARPVVVRPEQDDEGVLAVPGLGLFPRTAVRVERDGVVSWIDPAMPISRTDILPRRFRGALMLVAGDLPQVIADDLVPDGTVQIEAEMTVDARGRGATQVDVSVDDEAAMALREILVPLNASVRKQWLSDLLTTVRPDATDLELTLAGVESPTGPLLMRVKFTDQLDVLGAGRIQGDVPAALALQLARVLPPNVLVQERLVLRGADGLVPQVAVPVEEAIDPRALVKRRIELREDGMILHTVGFRPYRTAPAEDTTDGLLFQASERGPQVHFFTGSSGAAAKQVRGTAGDLDSMVAEAVFWYRVGQDAKADKVLKSAGKTAGTAELADSLRRLVPFGESRPWEPVWDAASDPDRLAIVEALEASGDRREAWRRATLLLNSEDPNVVIQALVQVARVQGAKPSGTLDPEAHKAWREPILLLQRAKKLAGEASPGTVVPEIEAGLATVLLADQKCELADDSVRALDPATTNPRQQAVIAEWRACRGELRATAGLPALMAASGYDPVVMRSAVRAYEHADQAREARRWALLAARILGTDRESWMRASGLSVRMGDLRTAVYAARNASDLEPRAMTANIPLQLLASLAGDRVNATLASQRADGYEVSKDPLPLSIELANRFMEPEQRLAFLRLREAEVMADPELLAERLALHEKLGDRAGTQRDAGWLVKRHKRPAAVAAGLRATTDALWSTHSLAVLDAVLKEPAARSARMEFSLFTGTSDPYQDARLLGAFGSAPLVRAAKEDPDQLLAGTTWPLAIDEPEVATPYGFVPAPLLGALEGAVGFTNPDANVSVIASRAGDLLPPPMAQVFQLGRSIAAFGPIEISRLQGHDSVAFVARRTVGDITWWGFAATPQLARFAVSEAVNAQGG